jgi:hypothetical protein
MMAPKSKPPPFPPIDLPTRVNLRAIPDPAADLDDRAVDTNSRRVGAAWGASTSLSDAEPEPTPEPAQKLASLRLEVPVYLDDELRLESARRGVTKQFLVLQALKAAGYTINDGDIIADRRRQRRTK